MDIYRYIRELAKSNKSQNLFVAAKEISSIYLFKNKCNYSRLQEIYLNWLYTYDMIMKDKITDNISKKVLEDNIYTDAYVIWRREKKFKEKESEDKKRRDVHLIAGRGIKFPKR